MAVNGKIPNFKVFWYIIFICTSESWWFAENEREYIFIVLFMQFFGRVTSVLWKGNLPHIPKDFSSNFYF